jgi:hypothetical protein
MKAVFLPGFLLLWCALLLAPRDASAAVAISAIGNVTISEDASTTAIPFTITGFQSRNPTVSGQSDNARLVRSAGIVFGGTGGSRTVTVTPEPDQSGTATITITATDLAGSDTETFVLTVRALNDPPTVSDVGDRTVAEDTVVGPLAFTVSDPETAAGQLSVTRTTSNEVLVPLSSIVLGGTAEARTVTVTPAANRSGTVTIGLFASDGVLTGSSRFTLTFTAVNDAPTVSDIRDQTINEDSTTGPLSFTIGDVDSSITALSVVATSSNQGLVPNANLTLTTGVTSPTLRTVTAVPLPNQFGLTTVTITVSDGVASSSDSFVLEVLGINDPPTISKLGSLTLLEDTSSGPLTFEIGDPETGPEKLVVTATSSDPSVISPKGIVLGGTGTARTFTLTPEPNASGSTLITLVVSDGERTAGMEFTVRVTPVDDPPTISNITDLSINEDTASGPIAFTVGDAETAASSLTVSASSANTTLVPAGGLVLGGSGANRTIAITPAANQVGSALITVTVSDGALSATDTFTVQVSAVNDAPTISRFVDQSISEDTSTAALSFTVGDLETAAANLTVSAVSSDPVLVPSGGFAFGGSGANRTLTISPAANRSGSAVITVSVSDGSASSSTPFTLTVSAVNDAPTISNIADQSINEDGSTGALAFTVGDAETAAANLTVTATSSNPTLVPAGGLVLGGSGASRTITVTPAAGQSGSALVTVTVSDGSLSATDTFTVVVAAVNDAPTISNVADQSINEDGSTGALAFTVGDAETAAANLTVTATSSNPTLVPAGGLVLGGSGANRTITVTPVANQSGSALVTVTVSDGSLTATDTFTVVVAAVNDAPTISNIADQSINEDGSTGALAFTVGDAETAAASLTVTATSSNPSLVPAGGLVLGGSGASRTITVTPARDQTGSTLITVSVSDGAGSASDTFTVLVGVVNDPPTISSIADQAINEDASTGVLAFTVGDEETPAASLTVTATSSNPTLVPVAGLVFGGSGPNRTITVTPAPNQSGSALVTVTVSDGSLAAIETFTVVVAAINDAPTISNLADQSVDEDASTGALAFTVGDAETAVANLTVTATSSNPTLLPAAGLVLGGTGANRTITVTPGVNQSGSALVTVTVSDGSLTAIEAFTVSVAPVNDAPTISNIPDQSVQGGTSTGAVAFSVEDPDSAVGSLTLSALSSNPSLVPVSAVVFGGSAGNRTVTVTPVGTVGGSSVITVTVSDGSLSASDTFTVTVSSTVEAPKIAAAPVPATVNEGDTLVLSVSVTGTAPIRYQWLLNGRDLPDATLNTLTLRSIQSSQAGDYSVRVSNAAGSVTSAAAAIAVRRLDFGDAPDGTLSPAYPTLLARDGARHILTTGFSLGATVDSEPDALISPDATGDDRAGAVPDDEDGVEFLTVPWVGGQTATLRVTLTSAEGGPGRLDAFADFNQDGVWSIPSERIFTSQVLSPGVNTLQVPIPADLKPGSAVVRFRLSRQGGLGPTGLASDGEVEDHLVRLAQAPAPDILDFGDAPESSIAVLYRTLLQSGGPKHRVVQGFSLGKTVDTEKDGQPSPDALGDDNSPAGTDDEDGVQWPASLVPGTSATLLVQVTGKGLLDAWIDFNRTGGFDAADRVLTRFPVVPGDNSVVIQVPASVARGTTFARFRLSPNGVDHPDDRETPTVIVEGEVEDYRVEVAAAEEEWDFGDAPELAAGISGAAGYPTTLARNGARHRVEKGFFLGKLVDIEKDGQPDASATGDDLNPKEPDDEDGVVFAGAWTAGQSAAIVVTASGSGRLDAWVDFNRNSSWADGGEQIFVSIPLVSGPNSLTFAVPPTARPGATFARFRFSKEGKLGFDGPASTGEVEDYRVMVDAGAPCDLDSMGTDFWLAFPGNYPPSPNAPLRLTVCIAGPAGTTGTVAVAGIRFSKDFSIPAAQSVEVVLPDAASLGDAVDVVGRKGVRVTSSAPVAVYGLNRIPFSSDGFAGLPVGVIGKEYLVLAYPNVFNGVSALNGTQFAIVGTEDDTRVTIIPARSVLDHPAGEPFEVVLDRGQTYQLRDPEDATADLSGTEILADQPVAVFAGHQCANINSPSRLFCDYLVEQLPPVNAWGRVFHTAPLATRGSGDVFRLIASADQTKVFVNGADNGTLARGEVKTLQLTAASRINTDKPVYLAQFSTSSDFDGVKNADPFMVGVAPVPYYSRDQRICTGPAAFGSHFLAIVAPAGVVGSLTLNGAVVPAGSFSPIAGSGFSFARVPVAVGGHVLAANQPFSTMAYGFGPYESYGWPGAMHFGDLTPPTIVCPPDLSTNIGGVVAGTAAPRCSVGVPDFRPQAKVSDNCQVPTDRAVIQIPAPGTQVGAGEHEITLIAQDSAGNTASCSLMFTVIDTGPPVITCPKDFTVICNKGMGATVAFQVVARTACGTVVPVESVPASGSVFPPGVTTVTSKVPGFPNVVCTFKVNVVCPDASESWLVKRRSPTLAWDGPGVLEMAPALEGPWTAVPAAASPFTPAAFGDAQFFRVRPSGSGTSRLQGSTAGAEGIRLRIR